MTKIRLAVLIAAVVLVWAVLPAQASGAPVRCGDTITQDTELDGDLVDCPSAAFVIGADNVTLDLGGHLVSGKLRTVTHKFQCEEAGGGVIECAPCDEPGSSPCGPPFATPGGFVDVETETRGPDIAIDNTRGFDRVTVRNGLLENYLRGAVFENAAPFRIADLKVPGECFPGPGQDCGFLNSCTICLQDSHRGHVSNTADIFLEQVSGTLIRDASSARGGSANRNVFTGVGDVSLFGSDHNLIERTDFNHLNAVGLSDSSGNVVQRNHFTGSLHGLSIFGGAGNVVRRNHFDMAEAIFLEEGTTGNLIERNTLTGGREFTYSIGILGATGNTIRHNRIFDPDPSRGAAGGIGVCQGSSRNLIERNYMRDLMVGVNFGLDSGCSEDEPPMTDNVVRKNRITDSFGAFPGEGLPEASGDGIQLGRLARRTVVEDNIVRGNSGNGIRALHPSTRLGGNLAVRNGLLGIAAPFGAVDLGGNRAAKNGNPAQCVGVSCR